MDFELFKKIIDDLKQFDKRVKTVKLWKDGEPLLNSKLPEMIEYIKTKDVADRIELTTNGYLLNLDLSKKLIEAGLDRIIISIEGLTSEDYQNISGVNIDFEKLLSKIRDFYEHRKNCILHVKMVDAGLGQEYKDKFFEIFDNISDEIFIEKVVPCWPGFESSYIPLPELNVWGEELVKKEVCPLPFYSLSINVNGIVGLCCNDWEQGIVVGNVMEQNIKEIWTGNKTFVFQRMLLKKGRKLHPICSKCLYPEYVAVDFLDDRVDDILIKYTKLPHREDLE